LSLRGVAPKTRPFPQPSLQPTHTPLPPL